MRWRGRISPLVGLYRILLHILLRYFLPGWLFTLMRDVNGEPDKLSVMHLLGRDCYPFSAINAPSFNCFFDGHDVVAV